MGLCRHCDHLLAGVNTHLRDLAIRLGRIERAINREGAAMATINEALDTLSGQLDTLGADLTRELDDLVNALGGNLTPDQQAKVDALSSKLNDLKAAIDAADPDTTG